MSDHPSEEGVYRYLVPSGRHALLLQYENHPEYFGTICSRFAILPSAAQTSTQCGLRRAAELHSLIVQGGWSSEASKLKNALGGLIIPSPWDQVNQLKPSVSASVQREVMKKASSEAQALTDDERTTVVLGVVNDVLGRIKQVLPDFIRKSRR